MGNIMKTFGLIFAFLAIFFVSDFFNNNIILANIDNIIGISFITEPKNIAVNEISGGITIQAKIVLGQLRKWMLVVER